MDDLVRWLTAQLDADEETARATDKTLAQRNLQWAAEPVNDAFSRVLTARGYVVGTGEFNPEDSAHIAEWDPARVLREIDTKRQLLDEHQDVNDGSCGTCVDGEWGYPIHGGSSPQRFPCRTLRLLALPYADRPGFREEWKL
jgi:hypothetical protein